LAALAAAVFMLVEIRMTRPLSRAGRVRNAARLQQAFPASPIAGS
jgi:hypothetical protein